MKARLRKFRLPRSFRGSASRAQTTVVQRQQRYAAATDRDLCSGDLTASSGARESFAIVSGQSGGRFSRNRRLVVVAYRTWLHFYNCRALPGEYSFRGGILDIFAPDQMHPLRLELFGRSIRIDPHV